MSVAGSFKGSVTSGGLAAPTEESPLTIQLLDHTITADEQLQDPPSAVQGLANDPLQRSLTRKFTKTSFNHARTQRKYARYQEDRFVHKDDTDPTSPVNPKNARQKGKDRVKDLWRGKKFRQHQEEDSIIEVLYENQRGLFTFGVPHFSSKSLLNFDPKPWTNAKQRRSPVNITNAQVPDPNWEWAWKSWYVDMSRDVDEDGWEYSLAFYSTAWHGNHPWFHSFVRRRRWLRKRVRKQAHHGIAGGTVGQRHMAEAHMLTPEYFSIHPSTRRGHGLSTAGSIATSASGQQLSFEEVSGSGEESCPDIGTLLTRLKAAKIDRQKIVLVRSFIRDAEDELFYLEDEIPHIMSILMFQDSRRQLLKVLSKELDDATDHEKADNSSRKDGDMDRKRIGFLSKASAAADKEVKKLDFWSDIRSMVRSGHTTGAVDGWQGVDASGPLSNDTSEAKEPGKKTVQIEHHQSEPTKEYGGGSDAALHGGKG